MKTSDKYILEPHYSKFKSTFHYHLILTQEQKQDTRRIKFFYSINEILKADINKELEEMLINAFKNGVKYIKVEIGTDRLKQLLNEGYNERIK